MKTLFSSIMMVMVMAVNTFGQVNTDQGLISAVADAETTRRGCHHTWYENGVQHSENCEGFTVGPVIGYRFLPYSNEEANFDTGTMFSGIEIGYRMVVSHAIALRFTAQGLISLGDLKVEGLKTNAFELNVSGGIENAHGPVHFGVRGLLAYLNMRSSTTFENDEFILVQPWAGNQFEAGLLAEISGNIAAFKTKKLIVLKGQKFQTVRETPIELFAQFQFAKGLTKKLTINKELNVTNLKFSVGARIRF